jgi:hypothetical protein
MIKFDHSMVDQNQGREPMPHHAPFSIQDIQSAVEQGREAERARIIALLEALLKRTKMRGEYDDNNIGECVGIESAIALIKGEN